MIQTATVTKKQVATAREVTRWYLATHYRTLDEPGMPAMFCDPGRVGAFAVERAAVKRGDAEALFSLLVTTAMFQRLQDRIVMGILRGIELNTAHEVSSMDRLVGLSDQSECRHVQSTEALRTRCDLTKDLGSGLGVCSVNPSVQCHLKRHTVVLRRVIARGLHRNRSLGAERPEDLAQQCIGYNQAHSIAERRQIQPCPFS